ncbi:hypothetical protein FOZ61_002195 [Perkinsus olseni]|uniref:RING-type domain-containing protein n=1 Tax=Perkinsus olseni TaxID=32597 RepID=A0A7J6MUI3_PEROL|nr:hypothetical protein FOZ61_002195 [Perkinsus olseni]KAF4675213.1 hypothetical protein FOL46_002479 [Perkinsus olseni]
MDLRGRKAVALMLGKATLDIGLLLLCIHLETAEQVPKWLRFTFYIVFGFISGFGNLLVYNMTRLAAATSNSEWVRNLRSGMIFLPIVPMMTLLSISRHEGRSREGVDVYIPATTGSALLFVVMATAYYILWYLRHRHEIDLIDVDELGMFADLLRRRRQEPRRKTSEELDRILDANTLAWPREDSGTPLPVIMGHQRMMSSCPICLESFIELREAGDETCGEISLIKLCKHLVHRKCLKDWFKARNSIQCPVCKQDLTEPVTDIVLNEDSVMPAEASERT